MESLTKEFIFYFRITIYSAFDPDRGTEIANAQVPGNVVFKIK